MPLKMCSGCRKVKPIDEFHKHARNVDGLRTECKACRKLPTGYWRETDLKRRHGLTLRQFNEILARQGNACLICGRKTPNGHGWHVDHDHGCCPPDRSCDKCRRGILCASCNRGLGYFKDDPDRLRAAIRYLEGTYDVLGVGLQLLEAE